VKIVTHLLLILKSLMVGLYLHSRVHLYGMILKHTDTVTSHLTFSNLDNELEETRKETAEINSPVLWRQ
jgi:hypothetical protein